MNMKKKMLLTILALLAMGLVHGATITVTQPSGGTVTMGCPVQVMWTAVDVASNVRILLRRPGGALVATLATGLPASPGLYEWTVAAPAVAGETYKVHVRAVDGSAEGASAPFTVSGGGGVEMGLTIASPQGGESWEMGSTKKIQWTASNIPVNCRFLLVKDGQVKGIIRDSFPPGQGESIWNWVVGDYQGGPALAGSGYKVRMQLVDESFMAESANTFTITPKQIIIAPLGKIELMHMLPGLPDLVVCLIWDGNRPYVWENKRIKVRVKNIGRGSAPATTCTIYIEGHGTRSSPVPALAANTEFIIYSENKKWGTVGNKTVRATVDPAGQVKEVSEDNNEISKSIRVRYPHEDKYVTTTDICSDQN
jgi:hypothetical protein